MSKTCSKCGELKPVDMFYPHSQNCDGLRSDCKDCFNLSTRIRRRIERKDLMEFRAIKAERKAAKLLELRLKLKEGLHCVTLP